MVWDYVSELIRYYPCCDVWLWRKGNSMFLTAIWRGYGGKTPLIRNLSIRRHSVVVFALRPLYSRGNSSRYTLCTYCIYDLILRRPLSDQDYITSNNRVINAWRVGNDLERIGRGMFLRYYTGIFLEVLRKTRRKLGQDSLYLCKDLQPAPPKYEAGVLTARPRRSVQFMYETCWHMAMAMYRDTIALQGIELWLSSQFIDQTILFQLRNSSWKWVLQQALMAAVSRYVSMCSFLRVKLSTGQAELWVVCGSSALWHTSEGAWCVWYSVSYTRSEHQLRFIILNQTFMWRW
jgi:hypothetical protein